MWNTPHQWLYEGVINIVLTSDIRCSCGEILMYASTLKFAKAEGTTGPFQKRPKLEIEIG